MSNGILTPGQASISVVERLNLANAFCYQRPVGGSKLQVDWSLGLTKTEYLGAMIAAQMQDGNELLSKDRMEVIARGAVSLAEAVIAEAARRDEESDNG